MKKRVKKKIKIKINKIFKENMETESETKSEANAKKNGPPEPKDEDFDWIKEDNILLKEKFMSLPLFKWREILKKKIGNVKKSTYQNIVNIILKDYIFKGVNFRGEKDPQKNFLIYDFFEKGEDVIPSNLKPDFVLTKIEKNKFVKILNDNENIFNYDKNYFSFDDINLINVIGEVKINPNSIKNNNQKENYIEYCETMNKRYKDLKIKTILMYIMDQSYKDFWNKNFFVNKPIIIGYIPQMSNNNCLIKQKELYSDFLKLPEDAIDDTIEKEPEKEIKPIEIEEEKIELINTNSAISSSSKNIQEQLENKRKELNEYLKILKEKENLLNIYNDDIQKIKEKKRIIENSKKETLEIIKEKKKEIIRLEANQNLIKNENNNKNFLIDGPNQMKDIEKIGEKTNPTIHSKIIPLTINQTNEEKTFLGKKTSNNEEIGDKTDINTNK